MTNTWTQTPPTHAAPRRTPFADEAEVEAFVAELSRFERGEIDAERWRAYRVARGVYSQRQACLHMLRVKVPQGVVTAHQLLALADVAARWGGGGAHVTTRQDLEFHGVVPRELPAALRRLGEAGLTTTGACGNTVRNVVACPLAGVAVGEPFDVTPFAEAVSRHFLRHPLASSLPRKFKIAFEGCTEDHAASAIQDLGFRARVRGEGGAAERGFAVTAAGGTSTLCASGALLLEFLPAADVLALVEAVVRVYHARGDREHRQRNRLKFLVRELGFDAFRRLVAEELARVRAEGAPRLPFDAGHPPREAPPARERPRPAPAAIFDPRALRAFLRTNTQRQRQEGYSIVTLAPPQGDVTEAQLGALARICQELGDGTARLGNEGRIHLRWIANRDLAALYSRLRAARLAWDGAGTAADVVACPGSDVCELAITRTRGVARAIGERVRGRVDGAAEPLPVHVSGCPHGCARHHVAAIGLQGAATRLGARAVPQYAVCVGGAPGPDGARFAKLAGKVPARRAPEAVARLVALWHARRQEGESAADFFSRALDEARAAIADLAGLRLEDATEQDFVEPGADEPFLLAVQGGRRAA